MNRSSKPNLSRADRDRVTFRLSISVLYDDPRLRALVSEEIPGPIQDVLFARSRDEIRNALADTAELIGFAVMMGEQGADMARYWGDILLAQSVLKRHWVPPFGPPPPTPKKRGRPEGSKKPEVQKRAEDEKQLQKVRAAIKEWYATNERYPTIPEAMLQMGWRGDPRRMRELLDAFNLLPWDTFVRQVVQS